MCVISVLMPVFSFPIPVRPNLKIVKLWAFFVVFVPFDHRVQWLRCIDGLSLNEKFIFFVTQGRHFVTH